MQAIKLRDVGKGYEQCKSLNDVVAKDGKKLMDDLTSTIKNLKVRWVGADATVHINRLIDVRDGLNALLKDAIGITALAGASIIDIQSVIKANGGAIEVGQALLDKIEDALAIPKGDTTNEFNVDPAAVNDYNKLVEICDSYETFEGELKNQKDDLFSNWTEGAGIENAKKCFSEFFENSSTYKNYLTDARDNLKIAVDNISRLG